MVDDFEDGDALPISDLFGPFSCYAFSQVQPAPRCSIVTGCGGGRGLAITFDLQVPAGANPGDFGFGFGTATEPNPSGANQTLDFSVLTRVNFDLKWDTDLPELAGDGSMAVHLPCIGLQSSTAAPAPGFSVEHAVPRTSEWTHYSLLLDEFAQPDWPTVRIDKRGCLPIIDGVFFELKAPPIMADGQPATATMTIDNLALE